MNQDWASFRQFDSKNGPLAEAESHFKFSAASARHNPIEFR